MPFFDGALHEALHHVIGVVAVAEQVLAAEQHLQRGLGHRLFQLAQADPRVLAEKADAGVKGGAAPALQRAVADVVQLSGNGQHIVETQTVANRDWWASRRTTSVMATVMNSSVN